MASVSDHLKDPAIDGALDQLDTERNAGLSLLAFSRTVVDRPENYAKIANSYAGHAADLQIYCVLREIRLWTCRIWERNGNSLPRLREMLDGQSDRILNARRKAHPDWSSDPLEEKTLPTVLSDWCARIRELSDGSLIKKLRVVRDEHFAHLLEGKAGVRKTTPVELIEEGYSYNDVFELVDESCRLIAEAIRIWRFHVLDHDGRYKILLEYYEAYWEFFPNLSELEAEKREKALAKRKLARTSDP